MSGVDTSPATSDGNAAPNAKQRGALKRSGGEKAARDEAGKNSSRGRKGSSKGLSKLAPALSPKRTLDAWVVRDTPAPGRSSKKRAALRSLSPDAPIETAPVAEDETSPVVVSERVRPSKDTTTVVEELDEGLSSPLSPASCGNESHPCVAGSTAVTPPRGSPVNGTTSSSSSRISIRARSPAELSSFSSEQVLAAGGSRSGSKKRRSKDGGRSKSPRASVNRSKKSKVSAAETGGESKGTDTFTRRRLKPDAGSTRSKREKADDTCESGNADGGGSSPTTSAAGTSAERAVSVPSSGRRRQSSRSCKLQAEAPHQARPSSPAKSRKDAGATENACALDHRTSAASSTPGLPPQRNCIVIDNGGSSPSLPTAARMPKTTVRGAAAVAAAAIAAAAAAAAAAGAGRQPLTKEPALGAKKPGAKKPAGASKTKKAKPALPAKRRHFSALVAGPGGGSGWAKKEETGKSSNNGKKAKQGDGAESEEARRAVSTVLASTVDISSVVEGSSSSSGSAKGAENGGSTSAVGHSPTKVGAASVGADGTAENADTAAPVLADRNAGDDETVGIPSKRPLVTSEITAEEDADVSTPSSSAAAGGVDAKAVRMSPGTKKRKVAEAGADTKAKWDTTEDVNEGCTISGDALKTDERPNVGPMGAHPQEQQSTVPQGMEKAVKSDDGNRSHDNDDGKDDAIVPASAGDGSGDANGRLPTRSTKTAPPSPVSVDNPPLPTQSAVQRGVVAASAGADMEADSRSSTADASGHVPGRRGRESRTRAGAGGTGLAWNEETGAVVAMGASASSEEDDMDTHVTIGGVQQTRCRHCRSRLARAGCSMGACLDCCFKAARPCAAHAKQLDRKRLEEELLAAGPSQSQLREKRNIKGVFKEETFHAIGDTATVWCFMDFMCAKSTQAAFATFSRTQRAAAGRKAPRMSRRASGGRRGSVGGGGGEGSVIGISLSATTAVVAAAAGGQGGDEGATATTAAAVASARTAARPVVRPALKRWQRKNAQMLAALDSSNTVEGCSSRLSMAGAAASAAAAAAAAAAADVKTASEVALGADTSLAAQEVARRGVAVL